MTEKRYQLKQEQLDYPIVNFYSDLIDTENNNKVICSFDNDIGTSKMVDLLNKQDKYIKELKEDLNDALIRIEERSVDIQLLIKENKNLKKENELKGDFRNFISEDIVRIKKENKDLKIQLQNTSAQRDEFYTGARENANRVGKLKKENKQLKKYNKGQELEIVRLHNLADAMSAVLRELGIYDVYDDEQIKNVKKKITNV